jgi:catechol 2,3-dioxygenase-like lactoylglutathione lyase family enzyme
VRDLAASVGFYTGVLGFTEYFAVEGWSFLRLGAFEVMLGECADAPPASDLGDHSYVAFVLVTGIDELYARYREAGVAFGKTLRDEPWGNREFGMRTPDGHRFMFAEELPGGD